MVETLRCDPRLLEKALSGRTYVVTGATSGTGLATAVQLARQGGRVVAACRRAATGEALMKRLTGARGSVKVMELDLNSLASVRRFTRGFTAEHDKLHGLVNNAGVMNTPKGRTQDGFGA